MSEHTPGPWEVCHTAKGYPYQIIAPNSDNDAKGRVGKNVTRWGSISLPTSDEGKANARLIAAAPDLLAALEAVVHAYENGGMIDPIQQAIAAIAKARGAK